MSEKAKSRSYKMQWWTDGHTTISIRDIDTPPNGFYRGRHSRTKTS